MARTELKTKETNASVDAFIDEQGDDANHSEQRVELIRKLT